MITIFLAEDQSLLNSALAQLLDLEDDLQVVGTAQDGKTAYADILRLKPDVAVIDIEMPKMSGLDVAVQLHEGNFETKVLILTTFAQQAYFERAVKAEVAGYLLKDSPSADLIETIHAIVEGKTRYAPELVVGMLSAGHNPLTDREQSVLEASVQGNTTHEIAQTLHLSDGTIRNYLSAVFSKLGVHNRIEAIQVARENKWLDE